MQKISTLPFRGTAEQEQKLREIIDANKHDSSRLMGVMQQAQDVYGYLPIEVQQIIADGMGVPLEKSVRRGYLLCPVCPFAQGRIQHFRVLGHRLLRQGLRRCVQPYQRAVGYRRRRVYGGRQVLLTACRCIGACGLAPVLTVNDEVYGRLTADDVGGILAKYNN